MSDATNTSIKRKWSSGVVVVSLFSVSSALSGCEDASTDSRRNQYETKAECVADYSERECETQTRSSGGFFFLGPIYGGGWRNQGASAFAGGGGPGRAALASPDGVVAHKTQTARGGFGSTGRSYSSRGG
jgi:hypothetical protein